MHDTAMAYHAGILVNVTAIAILTDTVSLVFFQNCGLFIMITHPGYLIRVTRNVALLVLLGASSI
jgi:hypothetical protein